MEMPSVNWAFNAALMRCPDGDTAHVLTDTGFSGFQAVEIRLYGIDTKEIVGADQTQAILAREALVELCLGPLRIQTLKTSRGTDVRSFTRYIGHLWQRDSGLYINEEMVKRGFAVRLSGQKLSEMMKGNF